MTTKKMNYALWTIHALLALLFLFSGAMKFVMTVEEMTKQVSMPGWFLRFIGVAEILGGLGLVLPGLLKIRPALTPLAAAGLLIIMIGATVIAMSTMGVASGVIPLVVGILLAWVAYGRSALATSTAKT